MRLLRCSDNGAIALPEIFPDTEKPPPYAILSHTWEPDQEVTFKDLADGIGKNKNGYQKLRYCAEQAKSDGLEYYWVDACCIDKSNAAELQKAINSMFRYYMDAAACYVYLSDISSANESNEIAVLDIRSSRWFQRGWTLQELLAPIIVEFFSAGWERLGDKQSLQQHIQEATGLPIKVLHGAPLYQFSDKQKFSWIESRKTTVEEDKAYALMGLFDVEMPLRYGEGAPEAFKRLEKEIDKLNTCLKDLRSSDPRDDKKRIEESKGGLLADSCRWVLNNAAVQDWEGNPESRVLWVKGDPGKGKTMLICGIIDELQRSMSRAASLAFFFCQATDLRINNATSVLRGLLYMLVLQQPVLVSHIRARYDHAGKELFEDGNAWTALSVILTEMTMDARMRTSYLIVDALDECTENLDKLLVLIVHTSKSSRRVRWLISSRNEARIEQRLKSIGEKARLHLELRNNAEQVTQAVRAYVDHHLSHLPSMQDDSQLQEQVRAALIGKASGTFLWVSLVIQELGKPESWDPLAVIEDAPPGLFQLYDRMFKHIQQLPPRTATLCRSLLAIAAVTYRPLCLEEMVRLCEIESPSIRSTGTLIKLIAMCGSFFTIRESQVYLVHQSAKDYLGNAMQTAALPSQSRIHYKIFARSLEIMASTLKRDVCDLVQPDASLDHMISSEHDPLAAVRYSCVYWVDHLCDADRMTAGSELQDLTHRGMVDKFIRRHYLYWLESLSLCKSIGKGITSMNRLCALLENEHNEDDFAKLVHDARRFLMFHRGVIEVYPLQTYASALLFSPTGSMIRRLFRHEEPRHITIEPGLNHSWSACLQTFEGHEDDVNSIAFSHDSTRLVSASNDRSLKIWDTSSGVCLQTFKDHERGVRSAIFSHDSTRLASASKDGLIKIWDPSGTCLQTFKGHYYPVNSIVFSHDSVRMASASSDGTIKIWVMSGGCQTLEGHGDAVRSITFSHDSTRLASASDDSTVKLWHMSGACLHTFEVLDCSINTVAFSPDSTRLAAGSSDGAIRIWALSGACQTLMGHSDSVHSIAFSSSVIVSASADNMIKLWNLSGACLRTLEGHNGPVRWVSLSSDSTRLASASSDRTIKIWDVNMASIPDDSTYQSSSTSRQSHHGEVWPVELSPDLKRLASAGDDAINIWDARSCVFLYTLEHDYHAASSLVFSPDSRALASGYGDGTLKLWAMSSGTCVKSYEGHQNRVESIAFSSNSILLASASGDGTVMLWRTDSCVCFRKLQGHRKSVSSVAFSHDSITLASASRDNTIKIWNVNSGMCIRTLQEFHDPSCLVAFSPISTRLLSASLLYGTPNILGAVRLWNTNSGICIRTVKNLGDFNRIGLNALWPLRRSMSISSDSIWIARGGQNLLWLPAEYRPWGSALSDRLVAIGTRSGKVWTCSIGDG